LYFWSADWKAADQKYKGKQLLVEGTVVSAAENERQGKFGFTLEESKKDKGGFLVSTIVGCEVRSDALRDKLRTITKGQKIQARGNLIPGSRFPFLDQAVVVWKGGIGSGGK
jgi:hypothetical protein